MFKLKVKNAIVIYSYQERLISEMNTRLFCRVTQSARDAILLQEINWCQQWIKKNKLLIN